MKLVEFLVAGVKGCESGTATFVLRGTASSAASVLYNDAEATSQPGTNIITLDANGSAEVYCNAYVDCTLKTAAGATVRTVTVMNTATTTEVISDSFTGTSYTGSPTAVSQPVTLAAILNKWNDSAGSIGIDWKVSVAGVATNLSSAMAAFVGLFFNAKDPAFGAVGDGATDDTNAINAAITAASAAGGGIVFFPATTTNYKFTTLTISVANVTLMGCGPKASILQSSATSGALVTFTDHTSGAWKKMINLGVNGTGANANPVIAFQQTQQLVLDGVVIDCDSYTGSVVTRSATAGVTTIDMRNCVVTLGASNPIGLSNLAESGQTIWNVTNSRIQTVASWTGDVIKGADFNIKGCYIDTSLTTSGAYKHVNPQSAVTANKYVGSATGNTFVTGSATSKCFNLVSAVTGTKYFEDGNIFIGFTDPATIGSVCLIFSFLAATNSAIELFLGSRAAKTLSFTGDANTAAFLSATAAETIFFEHTVASDVTIASGTALLPPGSTCNLCISNTSGGARNIIFTDGTSSTSTNVANNEKINAQIRAQVNASGSTVVVVENISYLT